MIRHLIKLAWARKRANALLVLEIFASFVVVFAVASVGLVLHGRVSAPMGFVSDHLYTIAIDAHHLGDEMVVENQRARDAHLMEELLRLPEVTGIAATSFGPFELAYSGDELSFGGRTVDGGTTALSDGGAEALGLEVVHGRWFEEADDAFEWTPVVLNRRMVDELFGDEDPLGQTVHEDPEWRVVGVIDDFRKDGALSRLQRFFIRRLSLEKEGGPAPRRFLVAVAPGTTAAFEERALQVIRGLEPEWIVQIEPTDQVRRRNFALTIAPLVIAVLVAGFLMLMVFLGMVGVFWQSVTQRRGEIGLRRAMGARRTAIYGQSLLEIVIITLFGCAVASVLVVQLPLLGLVGSLGWGTVASALVLSTLLMCALAAASGLYPAWLAARIEPAHALHDE